MSQPEIVFSQFLTDALRLSAEGRECVNQLAEQAAKKRVSPAQVGELHRILHTLKGTASMVEGAAKIVEALHGIEGRLACQSVLDSALHPEWITLARESLEEAHEQLIRMQRRERFGGKLEPLVRGFLVQSNAKRDSGLIWFPLSGVSRILSPEEMGAGIALCIDGALVPVMSSSNAEVGESDFGLALRSTLGRAVVAVREVIGVRSWSEALKLGATSGLELLEKRAVTAARRKTRVAKKAA